MAVLAVGVGVALAAARLGRGPALPAGALVARLDRLRLRPGGVVEVALHRRLRAPEPAGDLRDRQALACAQVPRDRDRSAALPGSLLQAGHAQTVAHPYDSYRSCWTEWPSGVEAQLKQVPVATARNGRYALDVVGSARARLLLRAQEQARAERPRGQPLLVRSESLPGDATDARIRPTAEAASVPLIKLKPEAGMRERERDDPPLKMRAEDWASVGSALPTFSASRRHGSTWRLRR